MIQFFRRLRLNLLSRKSFGRYLMYAIGEIILVVLGILIALQINNWNEKQKYKANEAKILKELQADLEFTIQELDTVAVYHRYSVDRIKYINKHLVNDLAYNKKLDTAFGYLDVWDIPYIPNTAYQSLLSKGIDLIEDDSLKRHIVKVHDFDLKRLIEDLGEWEWSFNQNTTQRYMVANIRRSDDLEIFTATPNDYDALLQDEEFHNFINILMHIRDAHYRALKDTSIKVRDLVNHIDSYLNESEFNK